jgi:flavin reductase (DIM6/NTAB) family NADH-FMN oxidoreductase RutF
MARRFARKGHAKFAGTPWTCPQGVPRLTGAGAFLACRTERLVDGGDHAIVLGTVTTADAVAAAPLTYHDRRFGTHLPLGGQPPIDHPQR